MPYWPLFSDPAIQRFSALPPALYHIVAAEPTARLAKLRHAAEFIAVLQKGHRRSSANFGAQALLHNDGSAGVARSARLGLIASRKAAPRAVDRNRGKRLARAVFAAHAEKLPPLDLVLRLKNNLRGSGNAALRAELTRLVLDIADRAGKSFGGESGTKATVNVAIPQEKP